MRTRRTILALVAVIAVTAAACSGASQESSSAVADSPTTTIELPDLEFGRGVMPVSVPDAWPMPDQSVIGATMIDGVNGRTEVVATFPATVEEIVAYYTTNLPIVGFEIVKSEGTDGQWTIEFSGNGVTGVAAFKIAGSGVSAATLEFVGG
jgi:hypothetical protein